MAGRGRAGDHAGDALGQALRQAAVHDAAWPAVDAAAVGRAVAAGLAAARGGGPVPAVRPCGLAVLSAQVRLCRPLFGPAAGLVAALVLTLALLPRPVAPVTLDLCAPGLALAGLLAAFGGRRASSLATELACAARPGLLVLWRTALAISPAVVLATAASAVLALADGAGTALAPRVLPWLGPLLLLAGLQVLLALRLDPGPAAVPGLALWLLVCGAATLPQGRAALVWFNPARMAPAELLAVAAAGLALLAWAIARDAGRGRAGGVLP